MSRLTKVVSIHNNEPEFYEANIDLYPKMMGYEHQQAEMDCINKLGKLEDLEEELGCPLEVFVKMFFLGVVVKDDNYGANGFSEWPGDEIIINTHTKEFSIYCIGTWKLSDYQKTWWLKGDNNE